MDSNIRHAGRKAVSNSLDNRLKLPPVRVGTLKPKIILVPVDFTQCSQKAITYAVSLAKLFKSQIILLHISKLAPATPSPEFAVLQTDILNEQARDDAARQLSQWLDQVAAHVPARMQVRVGVSAQEEIVEAATETQCDLIVMATHGKSGLAHWFSGSVAEKVVQHAPCPVFVVREREHDFIKPKTTRRRALVPA
jgi:nucleotide-binding universal stress UspA family protein